MFYTVFNNIYIKAHHGHGKHLILIGTLLSGSILMVLNYYESWKDTSVLVMFGLSIPHTKVDTDWSYLKSMFPSKKFLYFDLIEVAVVSAG